MFVVCAHWKRLSGNFFLLKNTIYLNLLCSSLEAPHQGASNELHKKKLCAKIEKKYAGMRSAILNQENISVDSKMEKSNF